MTDKTTILTCDDCGLSYRASPIPHECAEWTKGQPRLIGEPNANADWCDDCHGYTHVSWCPSYEPPETEASQLCPDGINTIGPHDKYKGDVMERREWRVVKTIPDRPTSDVVLVFDNDDNGLRLPWHREELLKTIAWYANGYPKAAQALNSYKRQHTALVEQRDSLMAALLNAKRCLERPDRSQLSVRKAIEKADDALAAVEQGEETSG